eukprot:4908265-Pleurochrysis_carterae.AAC.1
MALARMCIGRYFDSSIRVQDRRIRDTSVHKHLVGSADSVCLRKVGKVLLTPARDVARADADAQGRESILATV